MKKIAFILFISIIGLRLFAQAHLPIDNYILLDIDRQTVEQGNCPNYVKPYSFWQEHNFKLPEALQYNTSRNVGWFWRKLMNEHFFITDTNNFKISIDPAINLQVKSQISGNNYYTNTRGLRIMSRLGNNFGFTSSFYENQSTFPLYFSNYTRQFRVIPGLGKMRNNNNVYDYAWAEAVFGFKISNYITLIAGNDKLFVGHGFRSMLLSDNAFGYPYINLAINYKKWQYAIIRTSFADFGRKNLLSADFFQAFNKKSAAYHILTYTPLSNCQLILFEGYLIKAQNTDLNYLNPVIFTSSTNSTNKYVLRGMAVNINIFKQLLLYSQLATDKTSLKSNTIAWQAGMRWFAWGNLYFQTEYNQSGNQVYNNIDTSLQYIHYNQPLAHPYGNGFNETILIANGHYKRFNLNYRVSFVNFLPQYTTLVYYRYEKFDKDWFSNAYLNAKSLQKHDICLSYLINPALNLKIECGYSRRIFENSVGIDNQQFVYIAFKSSLGNIYDDY